MIITDQREPVLLYMKPNTKPITKTFIIVPMMLGVSNNPILNQIGK